MLGLHTSSEALAELRRKTTRFLVSQPVGRDHHRTQVPEVEVLEVRERGLGAVAPFGEAQRRHHRLRERDQLVALDGGEALGCVLGVLLFHRLADGGDSAAEHLLGNGHVLWGKRGERRVAVCSSRPEAPGLGALGDGRARTPVGTILTAPAVSAGAFAVTAWTVPVAPRTIAVTPRAVTIAPRPVAIPTWPVPVATPVPAALGGKGRGHELIGRRRADHLDRLVLRRSGGLGGEDLEDVDPVEGVGVLHTELVAHRRIRQKGAVELPLGLTGTRLAPCPGAVGARAGQLDVHPQ